MAAHRARTQSEPVLWAFSVLAALQILTAGSALGDVIGKDTAGLLILLVAAAQAGVQFFVRGAVVATDNVAAFVDPAGTVVAGPASDVVDGRAVEVNAAG